MIEFSEEAVQKLAQFLKDLAEGEDGVVKQVTIPSDPEPSDD